MIYRPSRGKVWHVVHETLTGYKRVVTRTICGEEFQDGKRKKTGEPTCQRCIERDNPLVLSSAARSALEEAACGRDPNGPYLSNSRGWNELQERDLTNMAHDLTARGAALALDYTRGPFPLPDDAGVVHLRTPFSCTSRCSSRKDAPILPAFRGATTLSMYLKLRGIHEDDVVTCIACATGVLT